MTAFLKYSKGLHMDKLLDLFGFAPRIKPRANRMISVIQKSNGESLNNDTSSLRGGDPPATGEVQAKSGHHLPGGQAPH